MRVCTFACTCVRLCIQACKRICIHVCMHVCGCKYAYPHTKITLWLIHTHIQKKSHYDSLQSWCSEREWVIMWFFLYVGMHIHTCSRDVLNEYWWMSHNVIFFVCGYAYSSILVQNITTACMWVCIFAYLHLRVYILHTESAWSSSTPTPVAYSMAKLRWPCICVCVCVCVYMCVFMCVCMCVQQS